MIGLRGMTWNHPRGLDPLVAHAVEFERRHGIGIDWEARSLEAFEAHPLDDLAATYDLMVIDHPHVGMAAASGCLLPFDDVQEYNGQTVGGSHKTYFYRDQQWALAIDAATQVAARRANANVPWPSEWEEVVEMARRGRVLCPLAPVHALMCFFTHCANCGFPCNSQGQLNDEAAMESVLDRLTRFATLLPEDCFKMNPIAAFKRLATDDRFDYVPLIYGYVTYAQSPHGAPVEFGNIAGIREGNLSGSTLGGTGIAVSSRSGHAEIAASIARELASPTVQRGLYAAAGGQPAQRSAWTDEAVNTASNDFYRNTLLTIEAAYVRPRFDGYIGFQARAGNLVSACLRGEKTVRSTARDLNEAFAEAQDV